MEAGAKSGIRTVKWQQRTLYLPNLPEGEEASGCHDSGVRMRVPTWRLSSAQDRLWLARIAGLMQRCALAVVTMRYNTG